MTALWIILAIIVLLLLLPVGADAAFTGGVFSLSVKLGPLKLHLLPAKPKKKGKKPKEKKPKKPKEKKAGREKPKLKLTVEDIKEMAGLALRALSRLRRFLSIDVLMLHLRVAGDDPYDTVRQYGAVNAALGAILPQLQRAFKIKRQDIQTEIDFSQEKISADVRFAATYQIWEILCIAFCALGSAIVWLLRNRKRTKIALAAARAKAEKKSKADAQKEKKNRQAPCAAQERKGS